MSGKFEGGCLQGTIERDCQPYIAIMEIVYHIKIDTKNIQVSLMKLP